MERNSKTPHVLMVSFPAQGHLNPLLRLAKRIAAKGLLVTFTSTPEIGRMIFSSSQSFTPGIEQPVGHGFLQFEFFSDSWIFGDHLDLDILMPNLRKNGPKALTKIIEQQAALGRPVSCLINNPFLPWVLDVASEMNIPGAVLWVQSCAVFSIYYYYLHSLVQFPSEADPNIIVNIPGLPALNSTDLPTFLFNPGHRATLRTVIFEQFSNISKASWVFANTFKELEHDTIDNIFHRLPVMPVGPLVELDDDISQSNLRADLYKAADCIEWLDLQEPRSVVYVSVGSIVMLSKEEVEEMANGLQSCGQPFLWVVRKDTQCLLPDGFNEKLQGSNGLIVSWSPQDRVLAHNSLGCFVTHCGWNSTLEALSAGTPVITYAQYGDQVTDAKFLVDICRVGVRMNVPVERDELVQCVRAVMNGVKAEEMRIRAKEWSMAARKEAAAGGSSDRNVEAFVNEILRRA